jgi:hypothetical protein
MAATLTDIMRFFGYADHAQFRREWQQLSDPDKEELRELVAQELERAADPAA